MTWTTKAPALLPFALALGHGSAVRAAPTEPEELVNALIEVSECITCHAFGNASAHAVDPLYAPYVSWQGSMMANAARDPVFWAGVAIASQDLPEDTAACIRCHAPRAFLEGRHTAIAMDELTAADLEGVTCEACHRMMEDTSGETVVPGNALYLIDDVLVDGTVPRRGPWDYSDGVPPPPHPFINDPYIGTSRLCGTCHDVTTPRDRVDDEGNTIATGFNEQRTYSEWLNSAFSVPDTPSFRSCQDCHMPAVSDMPGCQQHVDVYAHAEGGRRHDLAGANKFMVGLLRGLYGDAGTEDVGDVYYDFTEARIDEFLATAATLAVEGPSSVHLGEGLDGLEVTVTNNSGHKLPTGYSEGRVMWIEVTAEYGQVEVYGSGVWDQTTGTFAEDPQVRTYRAVAEDFDDKATFHLLRNNHWLEDTRIPPLGLQPNLDTDPVTDRYVLGGDGAWPNYDTVTYSFAAATEVTDATPADTNDDVLNVRVRLLYLINSREYIEFLADENSTNEAGNFVAMLFDTAGGATPLVLAEEAIEVPIVGFTDVAGTGSSDETTGAPMTSGTGADGTTGSSTAMDDSGDTTGGPPQTEGGDGCGCRNASPTAAGWALLIAGLLGRRRSPRRRLRRP